MDGMDDPYVSKFIGTQTHDVDYSVFWYRQKLDNNYWSLTSHKQHVLDENIEDQALDLTSLRQVRDVWS